VGDFGLDDWEQVCTEQEWRVLLSGNGVSRAVSNKFAYESLYEIAQLAENDRALFAAVGTTNFEEVLNHLRTAAFVCQQVGHGEAAAETRYQAIHNALITAVHEHHVNWDRVVGHRLNQIREELRQFTAVFTTSYDLIFYWAMMAGPPHDPAQGFGDLFWNVEHTFVPTDTAPFDPDMTLMFWLHGGLHLYRSAAPWVTSKRVNQGANLLATFADDGHLPLYIGEGTADQKRHAIATSDYLEHAYRTLTGSDDNLVVLGQALGGTDQHLTRAVASVPRNVAYGVYAPNQLTANLQRATIEAALPNCALRFFDSRTHPLGDSALQIDES
jgi:hypothetical protein